MLNRPCLQCSSGELATIIDSDAPRRLFPFHDCTSQCGNNMLAMKRPIYFQDNALSGELIDHRQDSIRAAICQLVAHKIGRPALVRVGCRTMSNPLPTADLLPLLHCAPSGSNTSRRIKSSVTKSTAAPCKFLAFLASLITILLVLRLRCLDVDSC
jgi:hypothetical protein